METTRPSKGILDGDSSGTRDDIVELLTEAYWMEIETVMSYISASVNLDGVRAQEIRESLAEDVEEELGHARQFADRIKEHYTRIVEETDGVDPVTQDMVIAILRDEQGHRRLFEGFLREYEFEGKA
jgi:bacterioferritin